MSLRKYLDNIKPTFEKGGKLHAFRSVFDGLETFLYVPNTTSVSGTNIHDAIDSKRIMSFVVIALLPALLFGMYNIGYQNFAAAGKLAEASFWNMFMFGFLAVLPKLIVSYVVGLGIEFAWAQWKGEEIQEGYLVSGIIIPMIVPVSCPLWMLALACAFSVIFVKEIFGGTGMNIFNVAVAARMFLFFSYSSAMTGDRVWVATNSIFGLGNTLPDAFTAATPLGQLATGSMPDASLADMIIGFIPGSIGETSVIAIAIGAVILLWTGIASWKTMGSVFAGGIVMAVLFHALGMTPIQWYEHIVLGGFCFGAVFMATDPVTSARTETGKYYYGFFIGALAVIVRVMNPGFPEGMMLAIFFGNMIAPLIDYCVVQRNISRRAKRVTNEK
ncbi:MULTISPECIES: NADH:ubiquinone reductase (Na(+)-transporting) subunit B [Prevotellaceae]|jgi:NADH:ubiquinone oxidoreductase, B subunit|uniref:Na(+)-translocating NADH-quinone reductase subunit B n=1 Tax=Segatella oris F0302 TaxID=649760 RepID=D1QUG0_9BACT|nr:MULTISPECIES: NADH:ubiquinone reductase (Na(+)-transporting) subunit B [Prevotellaceae]EFB31084.1 NADH:ubiquinone oxidoreductase, B subunit [Segatella oris F0302]OFO84305.1 NADH:ubiquinone reductase (Na(+)-transporting) subunit B [Prevotella sp. HMSC077E08]OFP58698.1 NADH:ubiquinone reductase (Na(+)-transporting) subunit B [Prevotella sp. HMSC077E09]